jgi:hypothetical protein
MATRRYPWIRHILGVGVLAGATYAVWRAIEANRTEQGDAEWESQPFPFPPQPRVTDHPRSRSQAPAPAKAWLEPIDGGCPASHPVKAKLTSGIYHLPGGLNYERTSPDRCYHDAGAAEADGLRGAKN